jgi:hypothetical protein
LLVVVKDLGHVSFFFFGKVTCQRLITYQLFFLLHMLAYLSWLDLTFMSKAVS